MFNPLLGQHLRRYPPMPPNIFGGGGEPVDDRTSMAGEWTPSTRFPGPVGPPQRYPGDGSDDRSQLEERKRQLLERLRAAGVGKGMARGRGGMGYMQPRGIGRFLGGGPDPLRGLPQRPQQRNPGPWRGPPNEMLPPEDQQEIMPPDVQQMQNWPMPPAPVYQRPPIPTNWGMAPPPPGTYY